MIKSRARAYQWYNYRNYTQMVEQNKQTNIILNDKIEPNCTYIYLLVE